MRTIAHETAFQIALSNCSNKVGGEVRIDVILVKGEVSSQVHVFAEACC